MQERGIISHHRHLHQMIMMHHHRHPLCRHRIHRKHATPSLSSDNVPPVTKEPVTLKRKAPFGQASSRNRKTGIPSDSSSSSLLSSSSSSSKSKTSGSTDVSGKQFKGVVQPFYKSIHRSYKALDLKLWASDVHSFDRRSTFKALNEKMKVLLKKSEQSLRGDKARRNYTWMESFAEWVENGKRHPDRKNRIPIDEGWLSSWVHEQREAFKRNKLAED